ncbi:MAG: formyltetrahydrofolate deformylase [Ilumatobacteraceae bacterium]
MNTSVLRISCPDQPGLVAAVSSWVAGVGGNIVHAEQHTDRHDGMFFQRVEFTHGDMVGADSLRAGFAAVAANWAMDFTLEPLPWRPRTAVLCSRQLHCAADLLSRTTYGDLGLDIVGVVSNHADAQQLATSFGHTFFHVPVEGGDTGRAEQENTLSTILDSLQVDLVLLARYMLVLPGDLVRRWSGRMINIHHSFLPAFVGANPYRQAHDRGVKVIGATAHYVTEELDEGPIIAQDVARVTHRDDVEELTRIGRDLETVVLARAVRAHVEHRVLAWNNRTVVFG